MRGKKWLLTVVCALLLVGVVCVLSNWLIDPFGVFEASPLQWDSYAQTLNPRGSKVRYISERPGEYDSFVVGSSSAASYLPETLERYYGGSFYNMFHYGADTDYDRELVRYLLEQGEVKRIVLVLGLSDAYALHSKTEGLTAVPDYRVSGENEAAYKLRFLFASPSFAMEKLSSLRKDTEMPQTFDVFLPESGTYDKRLRDVESIGSLQDYLTLHGEDYLSETADTTLTDIERCAGNVAAIREMCGEAGTELTVILTPFCREQIEQYDNAALNAFYQALSGVTDYWNFSITPLTYDERFFYDVTHTRNAAANLVLARIAGDESVGLPDAFGVYCRQGEPTDAAQLKTAAGESAYLQNGSATVDALKAIVATEQGVEVSKLGYYWQYGPAADLQKYALQLTDASMREAVMGVSSINFSFLGINLGQIPSWKVWQAKGWSDIGGFIVPLLSGGLNYLSMFISQKMNGSVISNANGEKDEAAAKSAQTNKMMNLLMPLMSIWFGFIVPLGLSIYWLTQSLFGIVQDVFLTKHYRKIYDAEDVVRREKAAQRAAEEAEKERIRAARRAANPEGITENTSKKKQQLRERQGREAAAKDFEAKKRAAAGLAPEEAAEVLSGDPERPFSRGRAYSSEHYTKHEENE